MLSQPYYYCHHPNGVKVLPSYPQQQRRVRLYSQPGTDGSDHYNSDNYSRLVRGKWNSWAQLMTDRKSIPEPLDVAQLSRFSSLHNIPPYYHGGRTTYCRNEPQLKYSDDELNDRESPDLFRKKCHWHKRKLSIGIIAAVLVVLLVGLAAAMVKLFADWKVDFRFPLLDNFRIATLMVSVSRSGVQLVLTGSSLILQVTSALDFDNKLVIHWVNNNRNFCFATFLNETAFPSTLSFVASCEAAEKISTLLPMQFRVGREEIGFDNNIVVNGFSGFSGEKNLKSMSAPDALNFAFPRMPLPEAEIHQVEQFSTSRL